MRVLATGIAAAGVLAIAGAAQANLLVNGSFEHPRVLRSGFVRAGSPDLTGWNVVGPPRSGVAVFSGPLMAGAATLLAQDGSQWIDLTGNSVSPGEEVTQTVPTVVGAPYRLSFFVGHLDAASPFSDVVVSIDGHDLLRAINDNFADTMQNWEQFTLTFTAGAATTTIGFTDHDRAGATDNALDNVVLTELNEATRAPEPASASLLAGAFAALGLIRRRRCG
jgi:hypothetical protein